MNVVGQAIEFPMVRKGIGFTVVMSRETIEGVAGHPMASDEPERWLNNNMEFVTRIADRIRPLLTPRGARVVVEAKHIIAQGTPVGA
ncbi:hypothetical protein [Sphingomonas sp. UYP23]